MANVKKFHSRIVKKQILINATHDKVWKKISNIVGLPGWIDEIKKATYLSKIKRGVGAIRKLIFDDGNVIEEHIVIWNPNHSFSYIATTGLPLRVYHATLSVQPKNKKSAYLTWSTYLNSKKMTVKQFNEFILYLEAFYEKSLQNIKFQLEN
ncbi:MAG: SRPBCC family protein [Thaumarchaeota archaeon]|nr:SRPBCC family protein [Nitrososphaerota archaeon]